MKKLDLGQTLQLLGTAGVIIGILLLVYELNQNRDMMRAQTRNELSQNVVQLFASVGGDENLASIILRGHNGGNLSEVEQYMYERRMNAWFRYWENVHYQYRNGLYDDIEFSKQMEAISEGVSGRPGQVEYWCRVRHLYSPQFAVDLDDLLTAYTC